MKYPNAYLCVKKLFKAEILNIAASLLFLISAVFVVASGGSFSPEQFVPSDEKTTALAGVLISTLGAMIISLVAFILRILGLIRGMKDEPLFKTALIYVFVGFAAMIASNLNIGSISVQLTDSLKILSEVSTLLISLYIIFAIRSLAQKLDNSSVDSKGKVIIWILLSVFLMTFAVRIISISSSELASLLSVIAAVFEIISYIIFLVYLYQSKKMLVE